MVDVVIWENPLISWLSMVVTFIGLYFLLAILIKFLISRFNSLLKKRDSKSISYILQFLKNTKHFFLISFSLYFASVWVSIPENLFLYLKTIFMILFWIQVGIWVNHLLIRLLEIQNLKNNGDEDKTTLNALKTVLRIVLWSIVFILVIDNIPGVQITALITSLGIGGIAIGLAVQNILGDLFASLSISLDKPFVINDFIQVDNFFGTVEKIGLKSTRIRSLSGELLVFSNSDLLSSRIQNFKKLERRRIQIKLGVLYQTTPEQLRKIPEIIRSIIENLEGITLDRVHLSGFGDFSINFELVYWVESPDYVFHMDKKQMILMEIFEEFIKNDIEFAYPTQSIFIENNAKPNQLT